MSNMKTSYHTFDDDSIGRASDAVRKGMSYRKAEKKFGVPKSSIQRKVKNIQQQKYGRPPVFTIEEENKLSECLSLTAEWGFPLTAFDVRCIAKKFLDKRGTVEPRFKNNMPGKKWIQCFLNRQSIQLKTQMCNNIKRARAAVTPEAIEAYFDELIVSLKDVPEEAILNYDETSMQDNPGKSKVIVKRKCKHPERIIDFSKSHFSVMFAGTASGIPLPPYVVYKADNLYDTWTEGGPAGTRYNRSKSGWFEGNIFEDWFLTIALPYLKKLGDFPKAIIGDNLSSHISVNILKHCIENNIRFILLPPNSTHLCQPLDLAFFSPLKTVWRRQLTEWKLKYKGAIRKDQFPRLLKKTLDELQGHVATNLKAGFKKSGIAPLNRNKVLECLPKPKINQEDDCHASAAAWTSSFEEYLQSTREKETVVKPRKKKMTITPGKSLAECNIVKNLEKTTEPIKPRCQKQKQEIRTTNKGAHIKKKCSKKDKGKQKVMRVVQEDTTSGESDFSMSLHSSVGEEDFSILFDGDVQEDLDLETLDKQKLVYSDVQEMEVDIRPYGGINQSQPSASVKENEFVVVEFTYDKGKKYETKKEFIGKILEKNNATFKISYMRNYMGSQEVYVFPNVEDVEEEVELHRIKRVVAPFSEVRGRYIFHL